MITVLWRHAPGEDPSMTDRPGAAPSARVRRLVLAHGWTVLVVAAYALLVLAGVTQSSIGITGLRADPAAPQGRMVGGAVAIRSDEYLTSTPLLLGVAATGSAEDGNPLTAPQGFLTQLSAGPVSSLVLADGAVVRLGTVLPDAMLIAARWWLPFLLLALGAPALLGRLAGSRVAGILVAVVAVLSPASAWWSYSPLGVLGFTIAGCAAMMCAADAVHERRWWRAVGWGAVAAVLLARTPLHYQPWAIVVGLTILATVVVALVADPARRRGGVLAVLGVGSAALLLAGAVVLENLESIRATLGTVYPGGRWSSGSPQAVEQIFGATSLIGLKDLEVVGSNPSEISSSFAVAAVWAVLLLVAGVQFRDRVHRAATMTLLGFTGFWFVWSLVVFGDVRIPLLSMVPANRAADVLGYLALLLLGLVLPAVVRASVRGAVASATVVGVLAAYAGSMMRAEHVPGIAVGTVWVTSAVLAGVVLLISLRPRHWAGYAAAVVGAALLVWNVNPVLVGLADLRSGPTATRMLAEGAQARADGSVWASDDVFVDALLTATGVPSLSGRQLSGPDEREWSLLDPTGASRDVWNRGGSHIRFDWVPGSDVTFANPAPDVIQISVSPCELDERIPAVSTVVASRPLTDTCLQGAGTVTWGGQTRYLYRLNA
jgi:hypothetical protein